MERINGATQWNIVFTRMVHDWEVEVLASFYSCLYSHKFSGVGEDKLWWLPSNKGVFEVRTFYRVLSSHGCLTFPWKGIWRTKAPPRVAFLLGQQLEARFPPLTIFAVEAWLWLIDVGFASRMGNWWIISSFIVVWRMPCGMLFSAGLG